MSTSEASGAPLYRQRQVADAAAPARQTTVTRRHTCEEVEEVEHVEQVKEVEVFK